MTAQTHQRRLGDILTVLPFTLKRKNAAGTLTAVDLTGLTVKFSMVNAATDVVKVAESSTGITITDASAGEGYKKFAADDVDTAGRFHGTFTVFSGSESDSFPVVHDELVIDIDGDTQSAYEAFDAARS